MEKGELIGGEGHELSGAHREEFKQKIGATKEEIVALSDVEFGPDDQDERGKFDPETLELFQPTFYELLDNDNELKGIFVELTCPDCGHKKSLYDQRKGENFGTPFVLKKLETGREGNRYVSEVVLRPNSSLNRWFQNFSHYLDGLKGIYRACDEISDKEVKKNLEKSKMSCPYCKLKEAGHIE